MQIPWQKVVNALAALYRALLKGKTVGGVTWPEQGHTPSTGPSGQPHQPGPPIVGRR